MNETMEKQGVCPQSCAAGASCDGCADCGGRGGKSASGGAGSSTQAAAQGAAHGAAGAKAPRRKASSDTKKPLRAKKKEESTAEEDRRRRDENSVIGICPFFKQDRGNGRMSCEGGQIRFPDKDTRREFVYTLCAHPTGYKNCRMRIALEHYYERMYQDHE